MRLRDAGGVPALNRSLQLLARLDPAGASGLNARQLQAALGIPRASLFRLLNTLAQRGMVEQDLQTGRYRLGKGLMRLGFAARRASPLVDLSQEILRELALKTHLMSELATSVGAWTLAMLDTWLSETTQPKVMARPGLTFQLDHGVAHGLCYLTFDHTQGLDRYLRAQPYGETPAALPEQVARWRSVGYAWARQKDFAAKRGNARVAVPVFDPHAKPRRLAGTLGLVCDNAEITPLRAAQWGQLLKEQARALEKAL
ncbi:MAG: helix-turn-helix domain-containing protein [Planctomycetota bacterium]|nr:helix-turn-helix domain-containing protein [Planctomycetota bacterium]